MFSFFYLRNLFTRKNLLRIRFWPSSLLPQPVSLFSTHTLPLALISCGKRLHQRRNFCRLLSVYVAVYVLLAATILAFLFPLLLLHHPVPPFEIPEKREETINGAWTGTQSFVTFMTGNPIHMSFFLWKLSCREREGQEAMCLFVRCAIKQ